MSTPPVATPEINKAKNAPPHEVKINCAQLWSLAQAQAIRRLSTQRNEYYLFGSKKWMLVGDFTTRAARIAGVYASFYLEREDGGQAAFKGRFYWMGLAAFASKQVMCGLKFTKLVDAATNTPYLLPQKYQTRSARMDSEKETSGFSRTYSVGTGFTANSQTASFHARVHETVIRSRNR